MIGCVTYCSYHYSIIIRKPSYDVKFSKQYLSSYTNNNNINFDEHIIILLVVLKCTLTSKQTVTLDVVCPLL